MSHGKRSAGWAVRSSAVEGAVKRAVLLLAVLSLGMITIAVPVQAQTAGHFNVAYAQYPPTVSDFIFLHDWQVGSTLTISIDDPAVPGDVDYVVTGIDYVASTEGFLIVDIGPAFDIQAGHIVTVSDGTDSTSTVVANLEIVSADPGSDLVTGIAEPGKPVFVTPDEGVADYWADPAADGSWQVDMADYDLQPGGGVMAQQFDETGNSTQFDYGIPEGHFNVAYAQYPPATDVDFIYLDGWQVGSTLTISIDDPAVGGIDYAVTGIDVVSTEGFVVDIGPDFDIQTGHIVTVSDGTNSTSTVVTNLEIVSADPGSDLVTGIAEPGKPVFVTPDYATHYWVDPAADGSWQVDMADYDLQPGGGVAAQQYDQTGNATQFDYAISEAQLLVSEFSQPVDNEATNIAQAGRTVPFKFRVTDGNDVPVADLTDAQVVVELFACGPSMSTDAIEQYVTSTGLVNRGDGYYQYNVRTDRSWAGQCGTLGIDVGSGGIRTADFQFK